MFSYLFASDPQKLMHKYLQEECPDPNLWGEIAAYLVRGRRAKTRQAQAAITAYLDLREALGGLAAFRAAGELTYDSLCAPCRDFACTYTGPAGMDAETAMSWARYLLAADHLLALAYEASLSPGVSRREQAARMEAHFKNTQKEYLKPLRRERVIAGKTLEEPVQPPVASEAAAA